MGMALQVMLLVVAIVVAVAGIGVALALRMSGRQRRRTTRAGHRASTAVAAHPRVVHDGAPSASMARARAEAAAAAAAAAGAAAARAAEPQSPEEAHKAKLAALQAMLALGDAKAEKDGGSQTFADTQPVDDSHATTQFSESQLPDARAADPDRTLPQRRTGAR